MEKSYIVEFWSTASKAIRLYANRFSTGYTFNPSRFSFVLIFGYQFMCHEKLLPSKIYKMHYTTDVDLSLLLLVKSLVAGPLP
jgi:hypothetical protein